MQGINNVFEYSLAIGQDCDTFAIDPITARITLCDATVLDYETVVSYEFIVSLYIYLDYVRHLGTFYTIVVHFL